MQADTYSKAGTPPPSRPSDAAIATIASQSFVNEPLVRSLGQAGDYPVEALGPILGPAALAIANKTQCALATAGNTVLSAAALAAQPHRDVRMPHGEIVPLSLNCITVCESGERKSAADRVALAPIRQAEDVLRADYDEAWPDFANHRDAYAAERTRIVNKVKFDLKARRKALDELGSEPQPPLAHFLILPEPTIEGLIKCWPNAHGGLGLFMDEGGLFLGGYSMGKDHRLKTITTLSRLWDGSGCGRLRAGDGASILRGRRLSVHLMVQPRIARELFGNDEIWDQGLMARFLVVAPPTLAGTRSFRYPSEESDQTLLVYEEALKRLLDKKPLTADGRNELTPLALELDDEGEAIWIGFHNEVDRACGVGGPYLDIRGLAMKAPNHAARVAGVLTLVVDPDARFIRTEAMKSAVTLVKYHLGEALRLRQGSLVDQRIADAEGLRQWLTGWPERYISASDIAHSGPNALRDVQIVKDRMSILEENGHVKLAGPQNVGGRKRKQTWDLSILRPLLA